jgi:hypothetical protein
VTHKFSRYMILAIGALGLSALPALADNACASYAGSDNGSTYFTTGFSCYIGNLDFSNFTYTSSGSPSSNAIPAADVTVDVINGGNAGTGFSFNSSWTAVGAGAFSDADIGFNVTVLGGGAATLEDAALIQTGGVDGTNTGSIASVAENGCSNPSSGFPPCSQTWGVLTAQTSNTNASANDVIYSPTGTISVSKDITAHDGTGANTFSTISLVEDTFSQVPEPRSLAMLLGLVLVAGLSLKKKLQAQS